MDVSVQVMEGFIRVVYKEPEVMKIALAEASKLPSEVRPDGKEGIVYFFQ